MTYRVEIEKRARRQLERLPRHEQARIVARIRGLGDDPRPADSLKMSGFVNTWRIRIGRYRAVYEIHNEEILVLVIQIGHRKEVYRGLSQL